MNRFLSIDGGLNSISWEDYTNLQGPISIFTAAKLAQTDVNTPGNTNVPFDTLVQPSSDVNWAPGAFNFEIVNTGLYQIGLLFTLSHYNSAIAISIDGISNEYNQIPPNIPGISILPAPNYGPSILLSGFAIYNAGSNVRLRGRRLLDLIYAAVPSQPNFVGGNILSNRMVIIRLK